MTGSTSNADPLTGKTLRGYEIQEPIGVSRWGKVYRAFQPTMNRTVAVRVLSPEIATAAGQTERFLEDTRADAFLLHPHLVTVYEAGQSDGTYFCAMEHMDGPPLLQFLRKDGGVNEHHLLQTIAGVARALDFLWQRKVSHQPPIDKNVLTTIGGSVKLINVVPVDTAPSQSPQEDIVSLAVMVATLTNDIGPVSKSISEFVEGMLGAEGRKRFTSLADVATAAGKLDHKLFPPARAFKSTRVSPETNRARPLMIALIGLLWFALVGFVTWLWLHSRQH